MPCDNWDFPRLEYPAPVNHALSLQNALVIAPSCKLPTPPIQTIDSLSTRYWRSTFLGTTRTHRVEKKYPQSSGFDG